MKYILFGALMLLAACDTCPAKRDQLILTVPSDLMAKPEPLKTL